MRIKSVEVESESSWTIIYQVTFEPTWFERVILKKTETQKKYKDNGYTYMFGNGHVYTDQTGEDLGNGNWIGNAIDKWRRKW
jgi:hypothetical protein